MIMRCPECGKAFDVIWPHLWAYKEGKRYICSWHCLRALRKEEEPMGKLKKDGTPAKRPGPKPKPKEEKPVQEPETVTFVDGGLLPKVTAIEYRMTGIETAVGDFQYFRKTGYLDWNPLDGNGTVSMTVEEWRELMKHLPEIMKLLKVGEENVTE